jgi:hypothetical protein
VAEETPEGQLGTVAGHIVCAAGVVGVAGRVGAGEPREISVLEIGIGGTRERWKEPSGVLFPMCSS